MSPEQDIKQILIVDDDPNIRRLLSEALRLHGYKVHSFEEAETVLQELDKHDFDLALLDVMLPGTNGLQLCRKLRSLPKTRDLPIIMMSAFYKEADHSREAREQYGATGYLLKPFPLKALHEEITALIGSPALTPNAERLSIKGNLSETGFPRILHNLYSLRATGLLHLQNDSVKKVIYIRDGYPIFARSNMVREFLGQILVDTGHLNDEELKRSLDVARESGQRHGMALIDMGLINPHQLNDVLRTQVLEKLLDIFSWSEGSYQFVQAREFKQGVTSIDFSPANLILQGLREYASREQVLKILEPHLDHYPQLAENPLYRFQEIQLTAKEERIMASCQGSSTLSDILKRHVLSRKEAESLLATLLTTGILVSASEPVITTDASARDEAEEDIRTRRNSFLKDYAVMMEQDYFTLLGVSKSASSEQVREAYHDLVKEYHPDRFFEQDVLLDLTDKVNALFKRISDAHETLADENAKERYIRESEEVSPSPNDNLNQIVRTEVAYQKGKSLFEEKKYKEAQKAFAEALELSPNEAEYLMYKTWAAYKANPDGLGVMSETRKQLIRVTELSPRLGLAHLYLGYLCKEEHNVKEAQRRFERAVRCDPDCTEALRELRLMSLRKEKPEKKRKGLFGKMLR